MTLLAAPPAPDAVSPARLRARSAGRFAVGLALALARSLAIVLPVLLIATLITFLLGSVTGQDPASLVLGDQARPEDIERMRAHFGLDRPVAVRYVEWLAAAFQGDLGESWFTRIPVADSIATRLPVSFSIAIYALLLGTVAGVALGIVAALNEGGWIDRGVTLLASALSTIPGFVAAVALVVFLSVLVPVFPSGGYVPPQQDVGLWIGSITLPALALSLDAASDIARQLRTGLVGALQENYVVGATVRGFSRRRVVLVHALRNGSGPAVALLGMHLPRLIGGAVVTETVFAMPGLGLLTKQAALQGDIPVVQGALFVSILLVVASSAIVNVLLVVLRPAARRES
ncbi:ABC transporter permease [Microbacterium album]|uniref:ABC transporter permease n=1 Tax=Microbacterium album TaxID=2053191 RepID=A0A917MM17_9MICO|nr:ABC transporter permease [Microbacterium album]GGH41745.1 ABC transporter permease [Microbacterium album]